MLLDELHGQEVERCKVAKFELERVQGTSIQTSWKEFECQDVFFLGKSLFNKSTQHAPHGLLFQFIAKREE